jgi:hypothetical protein
MLIQIEHAVLYLNDNTDVYIRKNVAMFCTILKIIIM